MKGEVAEDLLNLSLSIGQPKKRKRTTDDNNKSLSIGTLLHARNRMLHHSSRSTPNSSNGLHLIRLLLLSASAASRLDPLSASQSLLLLYPLLSLSGDPIQRVAAYFSDAILASLLTPSSPFYPSLSPPPSPHEQFSAFTSLYTASPCLQFAHFTANQAIIEAFEAEEHYNGGCLHVVDFDVSYGCQWASLIQSLSDKANQLDKPVRLRITGFGSGEAELKETEAGLSGFAKGCRNLFFEFEGRSREAPNGFKDLDFISDQNSTVVVNSVFNPHLLKSSTLKSIQSLNPSLLILVEKEGGGTTTSETTSRRSFLSRFVESLHYFAAMFDSLDDCLPADSEERLRIERNYLGREIRSAVEMKEEEEEEEEKGVLMEYGRFETWKEVMERSGFEGVMMSSRCVSQAKLLLKIKNHWSDVEGHGGGARFRISERDGGRGISLGWQDRYLVTVTAWRCNSL